MLYFSIPDLFGWKNHHRHIHIHNVSKSTILKRIGWVIGFACNPREPCSRAEWSLFHYENTTYPDKPSSLESKTSLFLFNHSRFPLTGHNYLPLKNIIAESIVWRRLSHSPNEITNTIHRPVRTHTSTIHATKWNQITKFMHKINQNNRLNTVPNIRNKKNYKKQAFSYLKHYSKSRSLNTIDMCITW